MFTQPFLLIMKKSLHFLSFLLISSTVFAQKDVQKHIQTKFIMAENGSTITLDEGSFIFTGSLSMEGKKNITIKGKAKTKPFCRSKVKQMERKGLGFQMPKISQLKT